MTTVLRKSGIALAGDLPWGKHFCLFYETREDLFDILIPYFKAGLEKNERCLWVLSEPLNDVRDLDQSIADGSLEIRPAREWYLEDGRFDLQRVISGWMAKLEQALADGYDGLRVSGDTPWLQPNGVWEDFPEYESQLNEAISGRRILLLCTYSLPASGAAEILDVAENHEFAIAKRRGRWEVMRKEQEDALRESEERFRQMAESIREVFWVSTDDFGGAGSMLYVSPAYESVWGRTCESLYRDPRSFIDAIHPEDRERVLSVIQRDRAQGFEVEYRLVRADGSIRRIRARGFPIRDQSGRFYRIAGIAEDVTERKRAEDLLYEKEQEYRAIVETAPDQIIRYDRDFRRTYVNPAVVKAYGLPSEALIGKSIGSVVQDAGLSVKEEEFVRLRQRIAAVFETGKADEYELSFPTREGRRDFNVRLVPEVDVHGSVVNVLGISRDVTERSQAEEKLKHSESLLAEAERLAHIGSWERDVLRNMVTWSDELYRIFGVQPGEIDPVREAMEFVHPDDRALVLRAYNRSIETGEPYSFYYRVVRPDGDVRIVHSDSHFVKDEDGKPIRLFGATQDLTEIKRAEDKLKVTTEQLRTLSARLQSAREEEGIRIAREIHDELGSALTSLRWDLEGIKKSASQIPDLRTKIESMLALSDTTINIVRKIASDLRPSVLDVLGLIEAVEWQAQQFQDRTGIIVHCTRPANGVDLNQEQSTAFFRIFQEALTNILRHAQATRVDVTMVEDAGAFVLTIRDNGRGIREEEKSGQLAIGLLGMRERAHLIGGEIDISGVDGTGTTVTVRLPLMSVIR